MLLPTTCSLQTYRASIPPYHLNVVASASLAVLITAACDCLYSYTGTHARALDLSHASRSDRTLSVTQIGCRGRCTQTYMHWPIAIRGQRQDKAEKGKCLHKGNESSPNQERLPSIDRNWNFGFGSLNPQRMVGAAAALTRTRLGIQLIHPLTPLSCWTGKPGSILCKGPEVFCCPMFQWFLPQQGTSISSF